MDTEEQRELYDQCWVVITHVNAIIAGLERNKKRRQQANIDELISALVGVNQTVINLGAQFGVRV